MNKSIEKYDFGSIENIDNHIFSIVIKEGIEVNKTISEKILEILSEKIKSKSILIIDRINDYSYSLEGMMMLNDENLKHVAGTAIVTYTSGSEILGNNQIEIMREFGRNNLSIFNDLDDAIAWAELQLND